MQRRKVLLNEEVVGEMLCDGEMCVFDGVSEDLEDMFYQGFYLKDHLDDPDGESYLAPDANGSKFFRLASIADYPNVTFGPIEDLGE